MKTTVITPVWNRADLTGRFLIQNWLHLRDNTNVDWIIVDNGSTDGTKALLRRQTGQPDRRLTVVSLPTNVGFSGGNNAGVDEATGDIMIFLSNDVQVRGDYITPLVRAISAEPDALYGAELLGHDTGWNKFIENGRPIVIPYLTGWCIACARTLWVEIGPWDQLFNPCDYEDIDLSYRATKANKSLVPVRLPLHHDSGQSAARLSGGRLPVTMESQRRFMSKWDLKRA
jgi:GT2 family glycosyltransferase